MAKQFLEGYSLSAKSKGGEVSRINSKYADIGLSAPRPLTMGNSEKKNSPATGFNQYFIHPETRKLTDEVVDHEGLKQNPGFQLMVKRFVNQANKVAGTPSEKPAVEYYQEHHEIANNVGQQLKEYHPDYPHSPLELGATAASAYSQRNSEKNRLQQLGRLAETGEFPRHLLIHETLPASIKAGKTSREALGPLKLGDYAQSMIEPQTRAPIYTVDRHVHDLAMGRDYGEAPIGLSSSRRYKVIQAAAEAAHEQVDPGKKKYSSPEFQSLIWTGH
jgi:hypothetical protein